jgi:hypothetical protein
MVKVKIIFISILLIFGFPQSSISQIGLFGGANYNYVRNSVLQNDEPTYAWHFGGSAEFTPKSWNKFSIELRTMFSQKGYQQYADKWYTFQFTYFSFQPVIKYYPIDLLSVDIGLDLGSLIDTNIKKGTSTYNSFDAGIALGFTVFENRRIGFYSRLIYGLTPMLNYYRIDAMGNFTGEIEDLKNTCLLVGLRVNIYNEKIQF